MRTKHTQLLRLLLLVVAPHLTATTAPYFNIRSQGVNTVREMVGWQDLINRCDTDCWYGALAVAAEFDQTFKPERITRSLFGDDALCGTTLTISGSRVTNRNEHAWLADYFGLPTDFESTVNFKPRIQSVIVDLEGYFGLDNWHKGLYFRFNLPITNTRWNMHFCERVNEPGTNDYVAGYFIDDTVDRDNLLARATDFFTGASAPTIIGATTETTATFENLAASKWSRCTRAITRPADLELVLGCNIVCCDDYYFGLNLRTELPTGNKPCGTYLFEPIAGNGGHCTFGAGLNAYSRIWESDTCPDRSLSIYTDLNVVHLFDTCQTRCFDLCGKPNSRYMLAENMAPATNGVLGTKAFGGPTTEQLFQFNDEYAPVANLTTRHVTVSAPVQGDLSIKLAYNHGNGFCFDTGYNFWGRSCEKICPQQSPINRDISTWALKGDAHVYGFLSQTTIPLALAATESESTINAGTNFPHTTTADAQRNVGIDNPQFALNFTGDEIVATPNGVNSDVTRTSIQSVLLKECDIDYAGTKGISHKIFTHINYTWDERGTCVLWKPFVGAGASVEFTGPCTCVRDCAATCNSGSCVITTPYQWGAWIKGGAEFN